MSRPRLIGLLLLLVTLLVYAPAVRNGFVVYDDVEYVTNNPVVQNGLTWHGIQWAFNTLYACNWHPLTWLSHMLDCELFGLNAGAHHSVNVLFHAANAVLLFTLLLRLTAALWPSALVAALFAWHPLHVESVAWISERKDVLSTFFGLLTLLAYTRAVTGDRWQVTGKEPAPTPGWSRVTGRASPFYWLALFTFALGLMSKPMLVTLPFVMLLLDYWPLKRVAGDPLSQRINAADKWPVASVLRLALEKWPFFLLTAASCVVTLLAQGGGGAIATLGNFPLQFRFENALTAYGLYLWKTVWPVNLAVIYPWSREISPSAVGAAALVLIFLSAACWRLRKDRPYLFVGWLWFLGTLVPVIGLVQVGDAALADRYTYFPSIGVFVAVAFGFRELTSRFQFLRPAAAAAAVLILSGCLLVTEHQLRYWRSSESLFRHTLVATRNNDAAQSNLADALVLQGRYNEALECFREAARINPQNARHQNDIGTMLVARNRLDEALEHFATAARLDPADWQAPYLTGKALLKQGRDVEAIPCFRKALKIDPDNAVMLNYVAQVLASDENPKVRDGRTALVMASRANDLAGGVQPAVLDAMAMACAELGNFDEAQKAAQEALNLTLAGGQKNEAAAIQQRLRLYQNHQPFRQSFANRP